MKLKNVLLFAFLTLTLIPTIIISLLLYKSGFGLSMESYLRNLRESINVQADFVSQAIENSMISDYRFASRLLLSANAQGEFAATGELLNDFQLYLKSSDDKVTACILLDRKNAPVYTIGEQAVLDSVSMQLPKLSSTTRQEVMEFELRPGVYSLGIITPVLDGQNAYAGSFISIYDKAYFFKSISSYYKVSDASTYICRASGEIINSRKLMDETQNAAVAKALLNTSLLSEGRIDTAIGGARLSGYYINIHHSPWYLAGFINDALIYSFTNQFILFYIMLILLILAADIVLSFYFSRKVIKPINALIDVMDDYQNNPMTNRIELDEKKTGYFETQYLQTKFFNLMKTILRVQHNFEGVYQLYQSSDMGDINVDIDVKGQTVHSSKEVFQSLMNSLELPKEACVVERFTNCFCEKDQRLLMRMLEEMRDEHLSVTREIEVYTPHMGQKWLHILVVPMYSDERLSRLFIQLRDISSFKKQEQESIEQARKDSLTGLYNRSGFSDRVSAILQAKSGGGIHALLFIDMNYFKMVNDNLGHHAGDDLLRSIGGVLRSVGGYEHIIVSRFGGDEFAVFLPNTSLEIANKTKKILGERLYYPFILEKITFTVSASIGMATCMPDSDTTLEQLLEQADTIMYEVKREIKRGN